MRELTMHELEVELAEQLPARELMGSCGHPCGYQPSPPCAPPPPPPCAPPPCPVLSVGICIHVSL
jgi:hypothetical protein